MEFPKASAHALEILQVAPENRKPSQVQKLVRLTNGVKFFSELTRKEGSDALHVECCKHMGWATFEADSCVFRRGDPGDAFFIILEGSVKILVPGKPSDLPEFPGLKEVAEIGPGSSFGDLALMHNKPRSGTILCTSPTLLAVLPRHVYRIISQAYERSLNERVEFLRRLPMFKQLTRASLQQICLSLEEASYTKGQVIYAEGSSADLTYFLRTGQVQLTAVLETPAPVKSNLLWKRLGTLAPAKTPLQLSTKAAMDMFGHEDALASKAERDHACVCLSKTVDLYVVSSEVLLRKLQRGARAQLEMKARVSSQWKRDRLRSLRSVEDFKTEALQPEVSLQKQLRPLDQVRKRLSLSNLLNSMKLMNSQRKPSKRSESLNAQMRAVLPVVPRQMSTHSVPILLQSRHLIRARSEAKLGKRWSWA